VFVWTKGQNKFTLLASFTGVSGSDPVGGLVTDAAGDLFGTTVYTSGTQAGNDARETGSFGAGDGTVFELPKGSTTLTTLATFNGANGQSPEGTLVIDTNGNLFGTTRSGGANGDGTVFELPFESGTIVTLASFDGTHGANPDSALLLDSAGNLFGATRAGGAANDGTVFEIPAAGSLTTLASFDGTNGASPSGGLVEDAGGNLFGNAASGGANNEGVLYEIAQGSGAITAIASFDGPGGSDPQGPLAIDPAGDLFGTAQLGGPSDDGTVFEIAAGTNALTTIAAFTGSNGALPEGLVADGNGNYFVMTAAGGANALGTLDRLLQGGAANAPGNLTASMGRTTLPAAVAAGQIVDSTVTVGLNDALPVDGPVSVRLYASADGQIDSAATLIHRAVADVNVKARSAFAINVPIASIPTTLAAGSYQLLAEVTDPAGNVAAATAGPAIQVVPSGATFGGAFTRITLPAQSVSGLSTPARATIQLSSRPPQGLFNVTLYLSPDGTVANGTAVRIAGSFNPLVLPGVPTFSVPLLRIPPGLAGSYYLVAQLTGATGVLATVVSAAPFDVVTAAAATSAQINAIQPATINLASPARASITVTLTNTGNVAAGSRAEPFILTLGLTTPDGSQAASLESFTPQILLRPGQSRTVRLTFRQSLLANVAPGSWLPTITVSPLAGSPAASATGPTPITVQ
jgi:uncharacterized repeat protein (TIGR03803 family)